jgi:DNA-binding SARP family transcriptional activator/predicted ATPase
MDMLHLRLLGPFEACSAGGSPVRIGANKAIGLIAYLALHQGQAQSREKLASLLWSMSDVGHARGSLRQAIMALRGAFAPIDWAGLRIGRSGIIIPRGSLWLDVEKFEALAKSERDEDLESAARLYRGPFLDGYSVREPEFAEWIETERLRLQELALAVLSRQLSIQLHHSDPQPAIDTALRLLKFDPWREAAHRALMSSYGRQGRRSAVIAHYRSLERLLKQELDVEPESETTDLLRQIERGRRTAPAPRPQTGHKAQEAVPHTTVFAGGSAEEGAERKHVTVVCALRRTAAADHEPDPEVGADSVRRLVHELFGAARAYGGQPIATPEGRVIAVFGAPFGQEHHAVRACLAALSMVKGARDVAGEEVAVGLASGIAILDRPTDAEKSFMFSGPAGRADALAHQAAAGQVLIASEVQSLCGDLTVSRRATAAVPDAGAGAPHELIAMVEPPSRWAARATRGLTPFVGRSRECRQLLDLMGLARTGSGNAVDIIGEAGVGKSRLVHEFLHSSTLEGFIAVEAGALPWHAGVPYRLLADLLRAWLEVDGRHSQEMVASRLRHAVEETDPQLMVILPALQSLLDLSVDGEEWQTLTPYQRRQRILSAVKTLLYRCAEGNPHLIVLEDMQWADVESRTVVEELINGIATSRMLLLVTFRPEFRPSWAGRSYCASIHLSPLDTESAAAFLRNHLAEEREVRSLLPIFVEATAATPLYLEEAIRALAETGVLAGVPGAYRLQGQLDEIKIPLTAQAVLSARIDRLPPLAKKMLQAASVIGRDVPLGLLASLAPMPAEERPDSLAKLLSAEFLYERPLLAEPVYCFKHALTRNAAYESLVRDRRRHLHARAATILEGGCPATPPEVLAHHLAQAGLTKRAAEVWVQAGQAALDRSAMHEAAHSLCQAAELIRQLPPSSEYRRRELGVLGKLGAALNNTLGPAAPMTQDVYERAERLARRIGDREGLFQARWNLWRVHNVRGECGRAVAIGQALLRDAEAERDLDHELQAHHALWSTHVVTGDLEAMCAHVEHGLALYETERHARHALAFGGHDARECGLTCSSTALLISGFPQRAWARHAQGLAHARALGRPEVLAHAYNFGLCLLQLAGELDGLASHIDELSGLADEHGLGAYEPQARFYAAWLAVVRDRDRQAVRPMRDFLDRRAAMGSLFLHSYFLMLLAGALLEAGEPDSALATLDEARSVAERTGERLWSAELERLRARAVLALNPCVCDAAEASLRAAMGEARRCSARLFELRAAIDLARLWMHQNRRAEAYEHLAPAYSAFPEGFDTPDLASARSLLDELGPSSGTADVAS